MSIRLGSSIESEESKAIGTSQRRVDDQPCGEGATEEERYITRNFLVSLLLMYSHITWVSINFDVHGTSNDHLLLKFTHENSLEFWRP